MSKFLYSNIEYVYDLGHPNSDRIRLGFFAEWFDGDDWRISLCAVTKLKPEDEARLDDLARSFLEDPFKLLYESTDRYFRQRSPRQSDHFLPKFMLKMFPGYTSIQSATLFESEASDESPEEIFKELAEALQKPSREAHWYHLPANPEVV